MLTRTFPTTGQAVRIVEQGGAPWFLAADVCAVLGIANVGNVLARLEEDEKGFIRLADGTPGNPNRAIVSEPGLYAVILRSDSPDARPFRRWVTHEVLPSLRKTGAYSLDIQVPKTLPEALRAYAAEVEAREAAEQRAAEGAAFKSAIEAGDGLSLRAFHKKYFSDVTERLFFDLLYAKGYLIDQRGKGEARPDGSLRDGSQHRHPGHRGKHYLYLHGVGVRGGKRRETTRVRPGEIELEFKQRLIADGLPANNNATGQLALEGALAS